MKISEIEQKKTKGKTRRMGKLIPIVAVLVAMLALSVAAYEILHADFYNNAFGTGIEGREGGPVDYYDADGNLVKTVNEPAVQRVDVDPELAEVLVGDATIDANTTVKVRDYTVTVGELVFDENGIGMVTVDIEHPQGHTCWNTEWWEASGYPICDFEAFYASDGAMVDSKGKIVTDGTTDTNVRLVFYITQFYESAENLDLILQFNAATELGESLTREELNNPGNNYSNEELWITEEIPIHIEKRVLTTELECGNRKISISPLGAKLQRVSNPGDLADEYNDAKTLTITYKDGSEYIVTGEGFANTGCGSKNEGKTWIAFNRLVDVNEIDHITVVDFSGNEFIF